MRHRNLPPAADSSAMERRLRGRSARRTALAVIGLGAAVAAAGCGAAGGGSAADGGDSGTAATASATATPTPTPKPVTFTIVSTGDVLLHERLWTQARQDAGPDGEMNFAPQLAQVKRLVEGASVGLCHIETPLAPKGGPYSGYPVFSSPPQIAKALAETGYDTCSTASNHTLDQGAAGIERTLDALDEAGLAHTGSARTEAEAKRVNILQVTPKEGGDPIPVAFLAYAYSWNGIPYPNGETWRANAIDAARIKADAAAARAAGAAVVVVSMQWGDEYVHAPSAQQAELAPALLADANVDLIIGHHVHVVQPVSQYHGKWVAFGHGNFMAAQHDPFGPKSEELLTRFTFTGDAASGYKVTKAEYQPLYQTHEFPVHVVNVPQALADGDTTSTTRARLEEVERNVTEVVHSDPLSESEATMIGAE